MNKLKEISNKYYQEVEIVMLATEKLIGEAPIMQEPDKLYPVRQYGNRNLYFLSNEEIKEGDWCIRINPDSSIIGLPFKADHIIVLSQSHKGYKKIVATTDTSLELPQPSKSFIQAFIAAYNEGEPITKVLVEMEGIGRMKSGGEFTPIIYQLKVNSSNEITIKKIKDSYTREEVVELFNKWRKDFPLHRGIQITDFDLNNWIAENL